METALEKHEQFEKNDLSYQNIVCTSFVLFKNFLIIKVINQNFDN